MSISMKPLVAIIVLTWNQRDLTLDCLTSLMQLDYPNHRLHLIVVDNGSIDGTVEALRQRYPQVVVLENEDNLGYAEGNNVGIHYAMEHGVDYMMLLNNDTVVDSNMLNALLEVTESNAKVGIVGPKILYFNPPDVIWSAGNHIDWTSGSLIRLQADERDPNQDEKPVEVDYITGCGICLRRRVIEQVGMLDPRFFIYYEESDWCLRAKKMGWRVHYVPQARLWHKVSATMGKTSPATDYYMARNVFLFIANHQQGIYKARALMRVASRMLLSIAAYSVKSNRGQRIPNRNARLLALRDAMLGRWGKMGADVAAICYPSSKV